MVLFNLGLTKGGRRRRAEEQTDVLEPLVGKLLLRALTLRVSDEPLLAGSAGFFRSWFDLACRELGLAQYGFKPYSLRRGGASHHWATTGNMSSTIERGRWSCIKTARIYLQESQAAVIELQMPKKGSFKALRCSQRMSQVSIRLHCV